MENLLISTVPIREIDANPFRLTGDYPYDQAKLETLIRSYQDVGMWPGVIGRIAGNRTQIAFGHHRVEAARRSNFKAIPVIIEDLTDERMLQYMGRENLEDFNASFLTLLETWQAGVNFPSIDGKTRQDIDIARILGWTTISKATEQLTPLARACRSAIALITGGYLARADLKGLSVTAAREIVERAYARHEQIDRMAAKAQTPAPTVEKMKRQVGDAAASVAKSYSSGQRGIGVKDLREQVDQRAFINAGKNKEVTPLFAMFGDAVAVSLRNMIRTDPVAQRLLQIAEAISEIESEVDRETVSRIKFELGELGERTKHWDERLTVRKDPKNVSPLRPVRSEGGK